MTITRAEAATLLTVSAAYDQRTIGEADANAWADALSRADVAFPEALEAVKGHYAETSQRLNPADVVQRVRTMRNSWAAQNLALPRGKEALDAHCGKAGCACTHGGGCFKGWIDHPDRDVTAPCPVCRADAAHRVCNVPPPGQRTAADQHILRTPGRDGDQL